MSISAAILILTIAVIRALAIHNLPKVTFVALWGVVLFRLLIPFSVPLPFNIPIADRTVALFTAEDTRAVTPNAPAIAHAPGINIIYNPAASAAPDGAAVRISPVVIIWLVGIMICALFFLVTHLRCRREYQTALPLENETVNEWLQTQKFIRPVQVRYSDRINAPMTYGIWKPVILFPKTTDWRDEAQLRVVLTHEITHIRRFDIVWKWLLAAALCVHWFNPLVWVMYVLVNRDIELSCDEKVVRTFGQKMKSAYALALIGLEENRFSPLCSHFAKNAIEERITTIMILRKTSLVGLIVAIALVSTLSVGALAMSAASDPPANDLMTADGVLTTPPASPDEDVPADAPDETDEATDPVPGHDEDPPDSLTENAADLDAGASANPFLELDREILSDRYVEWRISVDANMADGRVTVYESDGSSTTMSLEEFKELYGDKIRIVREEFGEDFAAVSIFVSEGESSGFEFSHSVEIPGGTETL